MRTPVQYHAPPFSATRSRGSFGHSLSDRAARPLLLKYEEMLRLRREQSAGAGGDPTLALRALARAFPGALRELDAIPLDELERRAVHLAWVLSDAGAAEPWVEPMFRYHEILRGELAERARGALRRGRPSIAALAILSTETSLGEPKLRELLFAFRRGLRR